MQSRKTIKKKKKKKETNKKTKIIAGTRMFYELWGNIPSKADRQNCSKSNNDIRVMT